MSDVFVVNLLAPKTIMLGILVLGFILFIVHQNDFRIFEKKIIENKNLKTGILLNGNSLPKGFSYVNLNEKRGPITLNAKEDNGKKRNLFNITTIEDDSLYYDYEKFNSLEKETSTKTEHFCEMFTNVRPETQKGYDIICPKYYTIKIDSTFYGRHKKDKKICNPNNKKIENDCGYEPEKYIKQLCEGRRYCSIVVRHPYLKDYCIGVPKYLEVEYHCVKDPELKKTNISIIQFYNGIDVNSIEENSVSEFYQYSKIHGYQYYFYDYNFSPSREVYMMKLYAIMDIMINELKNKRTGWIFYVDNDTFIINPNIKIEAYLPSDEMSKTHFIIADDYLKGGGYDGFNSGVFLIEIHEWSLDFLMRSITYPYYKPDKKLIYIDQQVLNNVALENEEDDHYVIVPCSWFNGHYSDFICHLIGGHKEQKWNNFNEKLNNVTSHPEIFSKTNEQIRKEVLEYYAKPKDQQVQVGIQN